MENQFLPAGHDSDGSEAPPAEGSGAGVLSVCNHLIEQLRLVRSNEFERGREWAIAITEAEKLRAWVLYTTSLKT